MTTSLVVKNANVIFLRVFFLPSLRCVDNSIVVTTLANPVRPQNAVRFRFWRVREVPVENFLWVKRPPGVGIFGIPGARMDVGVSFPKKRTLNVDGPASVVKKLDLENVRLHVAFAAHVKDDICVMIAGTRSST